MHDRRWTTRTRSWPRMRTRLLMAASLLTVVWLLATACTRATGTAQATPPGTDVVTAELAEGTWQGTFQVDGQLIDVPAHVGSAGCTAIGRMALDLHRGAIGTQGGVSGRLRVWAVTASGTTGTACGRRDRSRGSLQGTLSSDGTRLRADGFRLLGIAYGRLVASVRNFPVGPTMQLQQLQGRFGAGRSHHRSLQGTFTLTTSMVRADIRAVSGHIRDVPRHGSLLRLMLGPDAHGLLTRPADTGRNRPGRLPVGTTPRSQ
jgi:hypothetical protein